jgi:hypothetical protein
VRKPIHYFYFGPLSFLITPAVFVAGIHDDEKRFDYGERKMDRPKLIPCVD